jgi:hypothetical protein
MNDQAQPLPSKRIHANEIVHALTHDTDEPIYRLRNATIEGRLNLKHRVVKVAVDIQDCHFKTRWR